MSHDTAKPQTFAAQDISFSTNITPTACLCDDINTEASYHKSKKSPIVGKMANLLQRSISRSRENSASSTVSPAAPTSKRPSALLSNQIKLPRHANLDAVLKIFNESQDNFRKNNSASVFGSASPSRPPSTVKETNYVSLEYDPLTKRKVLNSYEIQGEIGRGEHGKVKLARDLNTNEYVAIKIVSRKLKREHLSLRHRSIIAAPNRPYSNYETKVRREIAIMKRCDHKYIVKLKEVLDDSSSHKIYLVLEYLTKGEIKWKRSEPISVPKPMYAPDDCKIPCCESVKRKDVTASILDEDNDLLSDIYSPNLTFKQSRKIFRDVLLGLEYLHMQGIVHRDIKPANLLVGADYSVKISDFGVSFASYLESSEDGFEMSDAELAKTVGTPAFFAPELCRTNFSANNSLVDVDAAGSPSKTCLADNSQSCSSSSHIPKVSYKIDIWALGVTLYCLLFGKVPFNAELEFALFDVIVNREVEFPEDRFAFHSPQEVSENEFELAKDFIRKLLDKRSESRPEIREIKEHPFVLMDLEEDIDKLNEFFFLNSPDSIAPFNSVGTEDAVTQDETEHAIAEASTRSSGNVLNLVRMRSESPGSKSPKSTSDSKDPKDLHLSNGPGDLREQNSLGSFRLNSSSAGAPSQHVSGETGEGRFNWSRDVSRKPSTDPANVLSQQNTGSRPSVIHGRNSIMFQDVFDSNSSSSSRRGSVGAIQEAPQIETKRNVGGDLYLKNQLALDTFKGIQQLDQKRRKHSGISSTQGKQSTKSSKSQLDPNVARKLSGSGSHSVTSDSSTTLSKIKVGPLSIKDGRRESSIISLPLTESFASLDSFNDDYLSYKYEEFKKKKFDPSNDKIDTPNLGFSESKAANDITEKFQNFNLGSLMNLKAKSNSNGKSGGVFEGIAPNATSRSALSRSNSESSVSSYSSSSGSDSEEEDNLTLKFNAKVAPRNRPPFLSLSNRAHSHESNLPNIAYQTPQSPTYIHGSQINSQNEFPELTDVPAGLFGKVQRADADMTPSVSIFSQNSAVTITKDTPTQTLRVPNRVSAQSSPLRNQVNVNNILGDESNEEDIQNAHYKNHYNKEPAKSPFPYSKHLDADKESMVKHEMTKGKERRPLHFRANSVTLGFLHHDANTSST